MSPPPITVQPYHLSSYSLLPTLLYANKVFILLATFPTNLNDHFSCLSSAIVAFVGLAHAGGLLVNLILGEPISLSNKILFMYTLLWASFIYLPAFRHLIIEHIYGKKSPTLVRFLLILFNQYNRAVAVLQRQNAFERMGLAGKESWIHGMDNLISIALLATLASTTGTIISSAVRPHLYKSYTPKPTDFFSVWWVFGLMVWYGLCREWNDGISLVTVLATCCTRLGWGSVAKTLIALPWTHADDVVFGYMIYPFVALVKGFLGRSGDRVVSSQKRIKVKRG